MPPVDPSMPPEMMPPMPPPPPPRVLVGVANDHTHEVVFNPDGTFTLAADPYDGHAHDSLEEILPVVKKEKAEDEAEVVQRVYELFKKAYEFDCKSIEAGQESEKFYCGEQWDPSLKRTLEAEGRACLTINLMQKFVDDFVGYQRQQRTDIRYLPVEGGDQRACDLYNIASKIILENCNFEMEESLVFEDQAIPGRGAFNVYVSHDKDIRGDARVESFPWDQVVFGPHVKPNGEDCEYLVKYSMRSIARLKAKYKKKAKDIENNFEMLSKIPEAVHHTFAADQYLKSENVVPVMIATGISTVDIALRELREFELQEIIYVDTYIIADPMAEFYVQAHGFTPKEIEQVRTMEGLAVIEKAVPKVRITRVVGNVLLSDENPADLPADELFCFPVYGKKKRNKFWGKVEVGKDTQREVNKRASQAIDIGNKMANYIWVVDQSMFATKEDFEDFKRNVSKPGYVVRVMSAATPPMRIEGTKFPGEIVGLMEMAESRLAVLVSVSSTSKAGANTSGTAILQAEKSALVGSESYFDNLSFAKKRIGRLLIPIIQRYYSPQRIYRMVADQNSKTPVMVGDQPFQDWSPEEIIQILEDAEDARIDVTVGEGQWSPTQRLATLNILTDAIAKGAPIPFDIVVPMFDMPEDVKQSIVQGMQAERQAAQAAEQQKAESEVQKTLIANNVVPPKVAQEQGLTPAQVQQLESASAPVQPQTGQGISDESINMIKAMTALKQLTKEDPKVEEPKPEPKKKPRKIRKSGQIGDRKFEIIEEEIEEEAA